MSQTAEKGRQVRGVFANYRRQVEIDGETRTGLASKVRGAYINDFAPGEEERLDRLGMLVPKGAEQPADRLEEAILRALNPLDVAAEDFGAPLTVSPPSLGAEPRGGFTKGDTGIDPELTPKPPEVERVVTVTSDEQEALDRLRAQPNSPRTDAPDVEDTATLSEFIKSERLNAGDTVALAEGDPERAEYVLEAEKAATGQDPRKSVAEPLQKIIDEGSGE